MKTVYSGGEAEIVEKKSRFIATVRPVSSEEEAVAFIAEMKKKYWDARHNCSAFVIGDRQEMSRCSDDGEPAQTAGRPMLDVLLRSSQDILAEYSLEQADLCVHIRNQSRKGLRQASLLIKRKDADCQWEPIIPDLGNYSIWLHKTGWKPCTIAFSTTGCRRN